MPHSNKQEDHYHHLPVMKWTHTMNDRATEVVASAAVTTPLWFSSLADISQIMATLTPILGGIWLVLQILFKCTEWWERRQFRLKQQRKEEQDAARSRVVSEVERIHRLEGDTWPET